MRNYCRVSIMVLCCALLLAGCGGGVSTFSAPAITNLSATTGLVGDAITITGANFGETQGASSVKFNGTAATCSSWTITVLTCTVPTGATTGKITVTTSAGTGTSTPNFTVTTLFRQKTEAKFNGYTCEFQNDEVYSLNMPSEGINGQTTTTESGYCTVAGGPPGGDNILLIDRSDSAYSAFENDVCVRVPQPELICVGPGEDLGDVIDQYYAAYVIN